MAAWVFKQQPYKALYMTFSVVILLVFHLPCWIILSLPRTLRPKPSWSLRKCLMVKTLRWATGLFLTVGELANSPDSNRLETKGLPPTSRGVWVDGLADTLVLDDIDKWAKEAGVKPRRIPGYWYARTSDTEDVKAKPGEKVAYHFHGGAYVMWSAHPSDANAAIPHVLLQHTSIGRVFSLEYRLSRTAGQKFVNPFPAALLDAVAGYHYLVTKAGFSPSDIYVTGDSAGAHLAIGLVRYLVAHTGSSHLPAPPSALVLLSPWGDLGDSHADSYQAASPTDYLRDHDFPDSAIAAFLGSHTLSRTTNPYISPSSRSLLGVPGVYTGFPRTFIAVGSAERPLEATKTLKELLCRDIGESNVGWYEGKDCVHDYCMFVWEEPVRSETVQSINGWLLNTNKL